MKYLKFRVLVLVTVLAFAAGAILNGLSLSRQGPELQLPAATMLIFSLLFSGIALWLGLQVRKYRSRDHRQDVPRMTPLLAARTAVFAQTCVYTGVILGGWHLALLLYQISLFTARSLWLPLIEVIVDLGAAALMVAVGLMVENMCKIPPRDTDDTDTGTRAPVTPRDSRGYAREG